MRSMELTKELIERRGWKIIGGPEPLVFVYTKKAKFDVRLDWYRETNQMRVGVPDFTRTPHSRTEPKRKLLFNGFIETEARFFSLMELLRL